jgi:hypothetical protein
VFFLTPFPYQRQRLDYVEVQGVVDSLGFSSWVNLEHLSVQFSLSVIMREVFSRYRPQSLDVHAELLRSLPR